MILWLLLRATIYLDKTAKLLVVELLFMYIIPSLSLVSNLLPANGQASRVFQNTCSARSHLYRPPHAPFTAGEENYFNTDLVDSMHNYSTKVIIGDFNAEQLSSSADSIFIKNLITDNALQSVPFGTTFHRDDSDTALDLCLVDSEDIIIDHWKSDPPFFDSHDLISATIKCSITKPILRDIVYRDFKSLDETALTDYLRTRDLSPFDNADSTLEMRIQCLHEHLNKAIDLHVPLKTVKQTGKSRQPWFTNELDLLNDVKDRRYMRFRRTRDPVDRQWFRKARNDALKAIEGAKQQYYYERLRTISDSKHLWNELRDLVLCSIGQDS